MVEMSQALDLTDVCFEQVGILNVLFTVIGKCINRVVTS